MEFFVFIFHLFSQQVIKDWRITIESWITTNDKISAFKNWLLCWDISTIGMPQKQPPDVHHGLWPSTSLKRDSSTGVISENTFFTERLWKTASDAWYFVWGTLLRKDDYEIFEGFHLNLVKPFKPLTSDFLNDVAKPNFKHGLSF